MQRSLDIPIPTQQWRGQPIKLYIEHHKSVSVLYADVVNYTHITTQLPVKTLVEVLHELFVKFDQASEVNMNRNILACVLCKISISFIVCCGIEKHLFYRFFVGIQCTTDKIFG